MVKPFKEEKESKSAVLLPYLGEVPAKMKQLIQKAGFKPILCSNVKFHQLFRGMKDNLGLRFPGVYM